MNDACLPFTPPLPTQPAEFSRRGGVDVGKTEDGTLYVGYTQGGEWLRYTVNFPYDGEHKHDVRQIAFATLELSGGAGRYATLEVVL